MAKTSSLILLKKDGISGTFFISISFQAFKLFSGIAS